MSVAERIGPNTKHVSYLPLATVYKLAAPSTPPEVREKIVQRLEAGEMMEASAIGYEVDIARREADRNKKEARKPENQRKRERSNAARRDRQFEEDRAKFHEEDARKKAARRSAAQLILFSLKDSDIAVLIDFLNVGEWLLASDIVEAREEL